MHGLFRSGLSRSEIADLFHFLDWLIRLPAEMDEQFAEATEELGEEANVPFVSVRERRALERGMAKGKSDFVRRLAVRRLGEPTLAAEAWLARVDEAAEWEAVAERLLEVENWDELMAG